MSSSTSSSEAVDLSAMRARRAAVAEFRRLADELEAGRLSGARIEWREGLGHLMTVELDGLEGPGARQVRMRRVEVGGWR